jgi:hypothetical protein
MPDDCYYQLIENWSASEPASDAVPPTRLPPPKKQRPWAAITVGSLFLLYYLAYVIAGCSGSLFHPQCPSETPRAFASDPHSLLS